MYIVSPFKKKSNGKEKAGLFSTHPSIAERIEALENIK
jgi:Zn-dependent protease with chaperone function